MLHQPPVWFILIAFIVALGPLVFIHELGHYLVARWCGVGAETFSIGFGREVTGWTDRRLPPPASIEAVRASDAWARSFSAETIGTLPSS